MSPEQIQAKKTDARSDIFSFGLVLYEMLTGRRAFDGENGASVMALILEREPAMDDVAPAELQKLVHRCLAKNPDERWQSARDLKAALEGIAEGVIAPVRFPTVVKRQSWRRLWLTLAAVGLALGAVAMWVRTPRKTPAAAVRLTFSPPEGLSIDRVPVALAPQVVVSPDGRSLVMPLNPGTEGSLWVRAIGSEAVRRLEGTLSARLPFWSPDSLSIGFFAAGQLKRVAASGGTPQVLCDGADHPTGATWNRDGTILFGASAHYTTPP
jgi:hypothetical protein